MRSDVKGRQTPSIWYKIRPEVVFMTKSTHLSIPRILMTLVLFLIMPYAIKAVNTMIQSQTISGTVILHTLTLILVIMNFDVLEVHYQRLKGKLGDFILFTLIGIALIGFITYLNSQWIHALLWKPEKEVLSSYAFFAPTVALAYSFSYSFSFMLAFKAFTDRFKVHIGELIIIFVSGISFGLLVAFSQSNLQMNYFISSFIYNTLITLVASYIYNQTNSILPVAISYGIVLLVILF